MNQSRGILIALIVCLALVGWMSYEMIVRHAAQLLWGYRPLVLFTGLWGLIVSIRLWFLDRKKEEGAINWRWLGLSYGSAILLSIGFPDLLPMPILMFIGFVPLLIVEAEVSKQYPAKTGRKVFRYAYQTFILWNILTTYWVTNTALVAGFFAIGTNALLMCGPFVLFHYTKRAMPRMGYAAFIAYWIAFEYLHLNWEMTWPWLTLGNSFAEFPSWIQWYEYTGVFGGSLWILLLNVMLFKAWQKYQTAQLTIKAWAYPLALIVLPIVASLVMYYNYQEIGKPANVVVVQPNYEPHYEKFDIPERMQLERFLELSASQVDTETDYLVFPETSFGYVETTRLEEYPTIQRIREFMQPFPKLKVIMGLNAYHDLLPDEPHGRATREREDKRGNKTYFEIYNAAIQLSNENPDIPFYKKSKLVPGPEIFPFRTLLFFMEPVIKKLEGTVEGVGGQAERGVMRSQSGVIAPVICYESIFGEYHTGYFRKGKEAQAIFVMTNDGWWDNTAGHRQHLYFSSLRAIETRRPVARSANTGISAFINQRGDITKATKYNEAAAIQSEILLNSNYTFYVQWGDIIARICIFLTIILLLNTLVWKLKKEKNV